jgi:nucleotide-binding universal stress UspA family protein
MKIIVAYDGTIQAKEALVYGMDKARSKGGEVVALHVFNSPLFVDYDATPDAEALARAEAGRFIDEAKAIIKEQGHDVKASLYSTDGNPEQEVLAFAKAEKADVLLCPPRFRKIIDSYRMARVGSTMADGTTELDVAALRVTK